MSMKECLECERPDLAVSMWLGEAVEKSSLASLPQEVVNAYLVDSFLSEVNSGGLSGLYAWQADNVSAMGPALHALGLEEMAILLDKTAGLLPIVEEEELADDPFEELDEVVIGASTQIERATHEYVKRHLDRFIGQNDIWTDRRPMRGIEYIRPAER